VTPVPDTYQFKNDRLKNLRTIATFRRMIEDHDEETGEPKKHGRYAIMSLDQRDVVIRQARLLIENLYVHLPHKNAMYGVDPVQHLRLLQSRQSRMKDAEFHYELLRVFDSLRDMHTTYVLPKRYWSVALLGIVVERCWEPKDVGVGDDAWQRITPRWIVTKFHDAFERRRYARTLKVGTEITHWNGMPMALAVERNGDAEAGGNPAARLASGLASMTQRCLAISPLPAEDWVDLRCRNVTAAGKTLETEVRLHWMVTDDLMGLELDDEATAAAMGLRSGLSLRTESIRGYAFNCRTAGRVAGKREIFRARRVCAGKYGYLRIFSFNMPTNEVEPFLARVERTLARLPKDGLIVDVRGNGGGQIEAAEGLLKLLADRRQVEQIEAEPMQFINSELTYDLCSGFEELFAWRESIGEATLTGAQYSAAFPVSRPDIVNPIPVRRKPRPVVLITDALSYSATDMLIAGFQDNGLGTVLGVDPSTGAGGGNVWTHRNMVAGWPGGPFEKLPGKAQLRVAARRSLRVGADAGRPVEDLGVDPDVDYHMTENDLLNGNADLLDFAASILA
jgi:Peptidase family S41